MAFEQQFKRPENYWAHGSMFRLNLIRDEMESHHRAFGQIIEGGDAMSHLAEDIFTDE